MLGYAFKSAWNSLWGHAKQGSCLSSLLHPIWWSLLGGSLTNLSRFEKIIGLHMKPTTATAASPVSSPQIPSFFGSKSSLQFKWPACHAQLFNPIYFTQHARKFTRSQCALNKLFMQPCLLQGGVDTVLVYYGSRRGILDKERSLFSASCVRTIRQILHISRWKLKNSIHVRPPSPQNNTSVLRFWFILYKKGTIYITFIKSFSIIKYNITLLQKFQIPATIQDKLPRRVHTVSFFFISFFQTTSSPSCANNSYKTRLFFLFFFCTVNNQVAIRVPASAKKRRP